MVPLLNINTFEIESSDDNSVRLTINFDAAFTRDNVIDTYCVMSVGGVCPDYSCVSPNSSYACEGLEAGGEYNFTVRTVNCGTQESNDTEVLTVIPRGEMIEGSSLDFVIYAQFIYIIHFTCKCHVCVCVCVCVCVPTQQFCLL